MTTAKKNKNVETTDTAGSDSLWRKPITLEPFDDEDPLAALYRGREVGETAKNAENPPQKAMITVAEPEKSKVSQKAVAQKPEEHTVKKMSESTKSINTVAEEPSRESGSPKMTEEELKNILRIKSDAFQFTDIREILRGKSFEIYAYLRYLAGDAKVCKIKHLDLMKKLDVSRPTLFKQGDWLTRLRLIEKRSVPGDHLGTSYTVQRVEEVLPIPEALAEQIQSEIENFASETG